jgi:hypothetical protein
MSAAPVAHGAVILTVADPDTGALTDLRALTPADVATHIETQRDIARARHVSAEVYRRVTDIVTPPVMVRAITEHIDALERWLTSDDPHVLSRSPRRKRAAA